MKKFPAPVAASRIRRELIKPAALEVKRFSIERTDGVREGIVWTQFAGCLSMDLNVFSNEKRSQQTFMEMKWKLILSTRQITP